MRDVIHRFNEIGPACLDPRWAGGRPRLLSPEDEQFVAQTAATRPSTLGRPLIRWSIRKLLAYLHRLPGRAFTLGREALCTLPARHGITFQRTKTWKESPDADFDAELDAIEYALTRRPKRTFAFDEFGPLGIRPTAGTGWAPEGRPDRLPATYRRTQGVFTPTYVSWANPIETHFGPLRQFTPANSDHPNHPVQTRALHTYLRWRNAHVRHPDVLAAQRRERARIRSEKGIRWGGRPLAAAA